MATAMPNQEQQLGRIEATVTYLAEQLKEDRIATRKQLEEDRREAKERTDMLRRMSDDLRNVADRQREHARMMHEQEERTKIAIGDVRNQAAANFELVNIHLKKLEAQIGTTAGEMTTLREDQTKLRGEVAEVKSDTTNLKRDTTNLQALEPQVTRISDYFKAGITYFLALGSTTGFAYWFFNTPMGQQILKGMGH